MRWINAADQPPLAHDKKAAAACRLIGTHLAKANPLGFSKGNMFFQLVDGFLISLPTGCCSVPRGGAQRERGYTKTTPTVVWSVWSALVESHAGPGETSVPP